MLQFPKVSRIFVVVKNKIVVERQNITSITGTTGATSNNTDDSARGTRGTFGTRGTALIETLSLLSREL